MTWLEKLKDETTNYLEIYREFKNSVAKAEKFVEDAFDEKVKSNKEKAAEIEEQERALYPSRDELKEKFDKFNLILKDFLIAEAEEKELTGKKIHYERILNENKFKFWKNNKTEKEELVATENRLREIKAKKAELYNKLYGNEITYDTVKKDLEDVESKIEHLIQQKQEALEDVNFENFFNSDNGRYVYKTYDKLRTIAINLADEEDIDLDIWGDLDLECLINPKIPFDELFVLVDCCTDRLTYNYYSEGTVAFDGASVLCEEQYNKLCEQRGFDDDEIQDSIFFKDYFLPPFYRAVSGKNALLINVNCEPNKASFVTGNSVEGGFKLESYDLTLEPFIEYYREMNDFQYLTVLSEKFLTAVLAEIENNPKMNIAELGLALRKKFNKKNEYETQITPMLRELDRLFKLTPEQTLIEEQRYYKQKELEQMEIDRQQREQDAAAEREMYEWQAEQDRRQREREAERQESEAERRHQEQLQAERDRAYAEQKRWEEDKKREEELEKKRQRERQREESERIRKEEKAKNDMRFLCWRCANYNHGCHGGIVGCGNFRAK